MRSPKAPGRSRSGGADPRHRRSCPTRIRDGTRDAGSATVRTSTHRPAACSCRSRPGPAGRRRTRHRCAPRERGGHPAPGRPWRSAPMEPWVRVVPRTPVMGTAKSGPGSGATTGSWRNDHANRALRNPDIDRRQMQTSPSVGHTVRDRRQPLGKVAYRPPSKAYRSPPGSGTSNALRVNDTRV